MAFALSSPQIRSLARLVKNDLCCGRWRTIRAMASGAKGGNMDYVHRIFEEYGGQNPLEPLHPKQSADATTAGVLYVVSTPIGNLEDITFRAMKCLRDVDIIAAENSFNTLNMLNKLFGEPDRSQRVIQHVDENWHQRGNEIMRLLRAGQKGALVTDAGTPGVSDPAHLLVRACYRYGIPVVPIPGPSAAAAAISVCGYHTQVFTVIGLISGSEKKGRTEAFRLIDELPHAVVMFESKHRILKTLEKLSHVESCKDRHITVIREMTKIHEEILRFNGPQEAFFYLEQKGRKGEFTLVFAPRSKDSLKAPKNQEGVDVPSIIMNMLREKLSPVTISKILQEQTTWSKRQIYNFALESQMKQDAEEDLGHTRVIEVESYFEKRPEKRQVPEDEESDEEESDS